jgi:hypothetical protein
MTTEERLTDTEVIWRSKADEQLVEAAANLRDYTEEGERIIRAELRRRNLSEPAPIERPEVDAVGLCPRCKHDRPVEVKSRRFRREVPITLAALAVGLFALVVVLAWTTGPLPPEGIRLFGNVEGLLVGAATGTALWTKREWKCPSCDLQSAEQPANRAPFTAATAGSHAARAVGARCIHWPQAVIRRVVRPGRSKSRGEGMNRAQRVIVFLGVVSLALLTAYPSWYREQWYGSELTGTEPAGRGWLWTGPVWPVVSAGRMRLRYEYEPSVKIDRGAMALQYGLVCLVTVAGVLLLRERPPKVH